MKSLSLIIAMVALATSCNRAGKQLREKIVNADSIAINFYKGDGTMDTVQAVKIVRDKNTINELTDLITTSGKGEVSKCGFDGSIHVFKMNRVIQDIDFSLNDTGGCNQFTFLLGGKYNATKVNAEAKDLLEKLKGN